MNVAILLVDVARLGIRLEAHGDTLRYHPRSAMAPDLAERLKLYKDELLGLLRPTPAVALPVATRNTAATPAKAICRCGSTRWRDVPIHDGQSLRRDCGAGGSLTFRFGTERMLDTKTSMAYDADMAKGRTNKLTDQLRQAIDDSGLTRYEIAKRTGIDESALAKFYNQRRGLSMQALNALGECLELTIVSRRKSEKKEK